jgi:undecaprenyl pyrophosphate synthase
MKSRGEIMWESNNDNRTNKTDGKGIWKKRKEMKVYKGYSKGRNSVSLTGLNK